jgi:3-oxocholest-4-en-26-oate---CoA ligase
MYHARFAPTLAQALEQALEKAHDQMPPMRLIHVDDESENAPLPGAVRYEELLASTSDEPLDLALSPDGRYVLLLAAPESQRQSNPARVILKACSN